MSSQGSDDYQRIDCAIYDQLELHAMRGRKLKLSLNLDESREVIASIEDLITREGMEYAQLSTGMEVRLDKIISFEIADHPMG